jgi:hypothetical protein
MDQARLRTVALETSLVLDESVDHSMASADTVPRAALPDQAEAIESPDESRDEVNPRSWRGVFAVEYPDVVLFTKRIDIRPDQLDEWKPDPVAGRGHSEDDD